MNLNLVKLTEKVCDLAKKVGLFIEEESQRFKTSDIKDNNKNSFVTYVDIEA